MPIYEYRCSSCGHQQEYLQKVSDAPITVCTQCGKETFTKMLTAAGFQLKGSGWYATDFKTPVKTASPAQDGAKSDAAKSGDAKSGDAKSGDAKPAESKPASESKSETPKAPSTPASGSGTPTT